MLRRYRKIKGDMPLSSGERLRVGELCSGMDRGRYSVCNHSAAKLMDNGCSPLDNWYSPLDNWYSPLSFISFYLHLSPFIYKASGACES